MANKSLLPLFLLLFWSNSVHSQPNWGEIVSPGFMILINEMNDSIASRRAQADRLRTEMNKIISDKGFDRTLIFGNDDQYFKEGMHKNFSSAPGPMQGNFERDKQIVKLENLHVQLYQSDKALFRWIDLLAKLRKHPDMSLYSRWVKDYNELPAKQQTKSVSDWQKWVANQLACDLANAMQPASPESSAEKVGRFDPKFLPRPWDTIKTLGADWTFPFPAEGILASLPMNGQFAFHPSESIPGVGYIVFPDATNQKIISLIYQENAQLKARWTSATGQIHYTAAEYRNFDGRFFFNLPKQLQPEMIYRLELVALPVGFKSAAPSTETCWQVLRGKPTPEKTSTDASVSGETKITELYFRAGKYDVMQKIQTMKGTMDWQRSALVYETDEPFDPIELGGSGRLPAPVWFDVQTSHFYKIRNALNARSVFYYLTVPKVEALENVPPTQLVAAELDNTLDAPFIRKISNGNPDVYPPNIPADRTRPLNLPGKYLAPAFKIHGIQDSFVTAQPVPYINQELFKKKKTLSFPRTKCTLFIGEMQQWVEVANILQRQLRRRLDERAQFFFELEKRRATRTGKPLTLTLEQIRQQEMENLPPEVKTLLDASFPDVFKNNFTLLYSRRFPGTEQFSASLELKLDQK